MNLSRSQKIIVGILTLIPFVLVPYLLFQVFFFVMEMIRYHHEEPDAASVVAGVFSFVFPAILTGILTLGLLIFYIIHVLGNKLLNGTEQIIWILIFIFIGAIGFPIYWFMRIWNEKI